MQHGKIASQPLGKIIFYHVPSGTRAVIVSPSPSQRATAACFNTWHCTGQHHHNLSGIPFHSENDGCCDHNHRNAQIPCSHQSSLTVPSRPHLLPAPDQIVLHTTDVVLHILVSCRECQQQYDECRVTLLIQERPEKPDTYLKYSIKALPSRAGTHIA